MKIPVSILIYLLVAVLYLTVTDPVKGADMNNQSGLSFNECLMKDSIHDIHAEDVDDPLEILSTPYKTPCVQTTAGNTFLHFFPDTFPFRVTGPPPEIFPVQDSLD